MIRERRRGKRGAIRGVHACYGRRVAVEKNLHAVVGCDIPANPCRRWVEPAQVEGGAIGIGTGRVVINGAKRTGGRTGVGGGVVGGSSGTDTGGMGASRSERTGGRTGVGGGVVDSSSWTDTGGMDASGAEGTSHRKSNHIIRGIDVVCSITTSDIVCF